MLTRIITAAAALVVFAAVVAAPAAVFKCALLIIIFAMVYESAQIMTKSVPLRALCAVSGLTAAAGMIFFNTNMPTAVSVGVLILAAVAMHGSVRHEEVFSSGFMTLYISVFMSYASLLKDGYGTTAMLLIFICAWTTDTGAYFAGSFCGRHKLMPRVSPKKTVEGSAGGILCAAAACMLYMFILKLMGMSAAGLDGFWGYVKIAALGAAASVISQCGDLAASAVKRDCGVKDYGKIFPGHGGFMDRFDSVIITAPAVYYIVSFIAG